MRIDPPNEYRKISSQSCLSAGRERRKCESIRQLWLINSTSNGAVCDGRTGDSDAANRTHFSVAAVADWLTAYLGYSSGWGYYLSGGLGLLLILVIILALMNRGARTL